MWNNFFCLSMDMNMIIGIIVVIVGLVVGVQVLTAISSSPLGDCENTDYNNDGTIDATDKTHAGYKACDGAIGSGFNILTIASSLIILLIIPIIYRFVGTRAA
jgi:hypothetical protein